MKRTGAACRGAVNVARHSQTDTLFPMGAPTSVANAGFGDETVSARVQHGVLQIEELIETELIAADAVLREVVSQRTGSAASRFRPLFTVLAAQLGPYPEAQQVSVAGSVIELVHLATLNHHGVLDDSAIHRGTDWATARWHNNIAILAGDYLFATASRLVARLGPDAVRVIADTFARMTTGQMRQRCSPGSDGDVIEHYLRIADEKTACLIAAAGQFGATVSGGGQRHVERLRQLGRLVGLVYQIAQDIRAISTESVETNPITSADLHAGAHSLPVVYALRERGFRSDRLRRVLALPLTEESWAEARQLVGSSSGIAMAQRTLRRYAARAQESLSVFADTPERRAMAALVDRLVAADGSLY